MPGEFDYTDSCTGCARQVAGGQQAVDDSQTDVRSILEAMLADHHWRAYVTGAVLGRRKDFPECDGPLRAIFFALKAMQTCVLVPPA